MEFFKLTIVARHSLLISTLFLLPHCAMAKTLTNNYLQHNLVSDQSGHADHTDPNLTNPWGVVFAPNDVVWIANNNSGTSTLYDGLGNIVPLVVKIPAAPSVGGTGTPTGIVFNNIATNWVVTSGGKSGPAAFIYATEDGTISAWAPTVNLAAAIITVDNSASKAVYKGLTTGANGTNSFLYAANFRSGNIDVFDSNFKPVVLIKGAFVDPNIPAGFAPFNVQNLNGNIYVTYAKQDSKKHDPIKGNGLGFVSVFDSNGKFISRVVSQGALNAPWGIVYAPASFGPFRNDLLIGNFGDGKINAFNPNTYFYNGTLNASDNVAHEAKGKQLSINGLWGLSFGNGLKNQSYDTLFFTAGPSNEGHGLYGTITPVN